jgi:hypothetical protein
MCIAYITIAVMYWKSNPLFTLQLTDKMYVPVCKIPLCTKFVGGTSDLNFKYKQYENILT